MANVNDQAPSFELKNTKKEPVSLDSYKGKTAVSYTHLTLPTKA